MDQNLPHVRIRYNSLIDPIFVFYCKNNPDLQERGWNDWSPPPKEEILRRVKAYKEEWKKYEKKILSALAETLGMDFRNSVIDVHIVSGNPRQIGDPIIIKSGFAPDEFVDTLAHELVHYLFSINNKNEIDDYLENPNEQESTLTRRHIIVFAFLSYLYREVMRDTARLKIDKRNAANHHSNEYIQAWNIVEEIGYETILAKFKSKRSVS